MSIDSVQPALGVQTMSPRQDAKDPSGREPPRDGKPVQPEQEQGQQPDQEPLVLNSLGQVIGKTINVTA